MRPLSVTRGQRTLVAQETARARLGSPSLDSSKELSWSNSLS